MSSRRSGWYVISFVMALFWLTRMEAKALALPPKGDGAGEVHDKPLFPLTGANLDDSNLDVAVPRPITPTMTAYDCNDPGAKTRTLDLTKPAECPDPKRDYEGPKSVQAVIIKKKDAVPHPVHHCAVRVTRQINHCYGVLSTSFGLATTMYKQPVLLDRDTCERAVEERVLVFEGHTFLLPDERSAPYHAAYFSKGHVDNYAGSCYPVSTTLPDGTYAHGVVEETRIEITARVVAGLWELESGAIVVDEHLPGVFRTGELMDAISGAYYWRDDGTQGACGLSLTQIFMGSAELYTPTAPHGTDPYLGSTLMVDNRNASQAIALVLGEPVLYCEVAECYVAKNLPGFAACFRTVSDEQPFQGSIGPRKEYGSGQHYDFIVRDAKDEAEWERALAWSRSDFMDFTAEFEHHRTMEEFVRAQCELERKTLWNKLQSMSGAANPHALYDIFGEGYTYVKVGSAVAYVTQCTPVLVELADAANCTLEVPVRRRNVDDTEWMDPLTKVLYRFPTEVVCSSLLPVRWDLEGTWYCSRPELVICAAPEQLKPSVGSYTASLDLFDKTSKTPLMQPGQIAQRDILFHQLSHREAVLVRVVQNALASVEEGGHIGTLISPQEVEMLKNEVGDRVLRIASPYWLMDWFGTAAIRLWAILMFIGVIITIISSCARGVATYLQLGWDDGRTLIKVFLAMFNCLLLPKTLWTFVAEQNKKTWNNIYSFFEFVQESGENGAGKKVQAEIDTPEVKRRFRDHFMDHDVFRDPRLKKAAESREEEDA